MRKIFFFLIFIFSLSIVYSNCNGLSDSLNKIVIGCSSTPPQSGSQNCTRITDYLCEYDTGAFYWDSITSIMDINISTEYSLIEASGFTIHNPQGGNIPWGASLNISFCNGLSCTQVYTGVGSCTGSGASPWQYYNSSFTTPFSGYVNRINIHGKNCGGSNEITIGELMLINESTSPLNDNSFPSVSIQNLKSIYCYNESWPIYHFTPNITDIENDDISWRYYWGSDPYAKTYIDQFTDDNYNMLDNGWDFNQSGCNYTTTNDELRLTDDCDNIAMIKWLYSGQLSNETTVSFKTVLFRNNSAEYCIYSWQNEKLTCMKIETFYDVNQQEHYSNLSYWNGSKYIYFDQSYSDGYLDVEYIMNGSHNHICAIDEYLTDDCTYEVTIPLLGTGQKNPAKFYMVGHYGYYYNGFYGSWNTLDDLAYDEYGIAWDPYTVGDVITHEFDQQGQEDLNILVTDNVNYPEYSRYVFPISVYGICTTQFNDTNTTVPDVTTDYINAIDNGPTVFNIVFYFVLFLFFIWMMFNSGSVELSLISVGAVGLLGSFLMSKDLTQMISSGSLIVLGLSLIIAKVF